MQMYFTLTPSLTRRGEGYFQKSIRYQKTPEISLRRFLFCVYRLAHGLTRIVTDIYLNFDNICDHLCLSVDP